MIFHNLCLATENFYLLTLLLSFINLLFTVVGGGNNFVKCAPWLIAIKVKWNNIRGFACLWGPYIWSPVPHINFTVKYTSDHRRLVCSVRVARAFLPSHHELFKNFLLFWLLQFVSSPQCFISQATNESNIFIANRSWLHFQKVAHIDYLCKKNVALFADL